MAFVHFAGPRRRMVHLKNDLDRLFEEFFGDADDLDQGEVSPSLSIEENPGNFVVRVELPGIPKEDVKVTFRDGRLYIAANKKEERENAVYVKNDRSFGKIARAIDLPHEVKSESIEAALENGLLTVTIAKEEEVKEPGVEVNIK